MDRQLLRQLHRPICQACRTASRNPTSSSIFTRTSLVPKRLNSNYAEGQPRPSANSIIHREIRRRIPISSTIEEAENSSSPPSAASSAGQAPTRAEVDHARELCDAILRHPSIPSEKETLVPLRAIESLAAKAAGVHQEPSTKTSPKIDENDSATPASELLSLDSITTSRRTTSRQTRPGPAASAATIDLLSTLAYKVIKHPPVFITPKILEVYTNLQHHLTRPSTLPEIFTLYGSKPIPQPPKIKIKTNNKYPPSSAPILSTITYTTQSPTAIASAIPTPIATLALTTAVRAHSLPIALSIITTTLTTPTFHRSKIFRRALPAILAIPLAPLAIYTLSTTLSTYQTTLPAENFTAIAFAGILTYTTAVGTIGYIALTTSNDQMQRVTWATGMPLWERWVREEERAAMDRVVQAWGFRERWRWGEEEGEEWEGLKEWAGVRGMVVDKVGLMEGME